MNSICKALFAKKLNLAVWKWISFGLFPLALNKDFGEKC